MSSYTRKAAVFVTLSLVLMLLVAQTNVFKGLPILTGAKAVKHKTSHTPPSLTEGNTIQSSSSSQPHSNSTPGGCINYDPSTRTITVSCSSSATRLTDIDNKLHDSSILVKQSAADGVVS